jgi:hypothetical protein
LFLRLNGTSAGTTYTIKVRIQATLTKLMKGASLSATFGSQDFVEWSLGRAKLDVDSYEIEIQKKDEFGGKTIDKIMKYKVTATKEDPNPLVVMFDPFVENRDGKCKASVTGRLFVISIVGSDGEKAEYPNKE